MPLEIDLNMSLDIDLNMSLDIDLEAQPDLNDESGDVENHDTVITGGGTAVLEAQHDPNDEGGAAIQKMLQFQKMNMMVMMNSTKVFHAISHVRFVLLLLPFR